MLEKERSLKATLSRSYIKVEREDENSIQSQSSRPESTILKRGGGSVSGSKDHLVLATARFHHDAAATS